MSDLEKIKYMATHAAMDVVKRVTEHPVMKSMKPELQEPIMQQTIEENPSIQFSYVVDMNGKKTTRNITNIGDRAKYENYGIGTDQSDREWFIKPLQSGKMYVTNFYISKMTGALCITVSAPIIDDDEEMVGIFGVDIKFEDWVKSVEQMAEATQSRSGKSMMRKASRTAGSNNCCLRLSSTDHTGMPPYAAKTGILP